MYDSVILCIFSFLLLKLSLIYRLCLFWIWFYSKTKLESLTSLIYVKTQYNEIKGQKSFVPFWTER